MQDDDYCSKLIFSLTKSLLAHILYMRGMIPATILQLDKYLANYQQENTVERVSTKIRKERKKALAVSKLISEMNLLLSEFESIIASSIKESRDMRLWVNITLGPTISNPRETYCMHFLCTQNSSKRSQPPPPTTEAEVSARIKRMEKILVRRFLEFSFKNSSESSAVISYGPAVTSKWNAFLSATILRPTVPVCPVPWSHPGMLLQQDSLLSTFAEAAEDSGVVPVTTGCGDMFCYREGSEFNLKQKPWNWPYDSHTAVKGSSSCSPPQAEKNSTEVTNKKSVTMIRKKASSNHPVEVTVDCCLGTISECSISKPTWDHVDGEGGDDGKGPMVSSCTPTAMQQLEEEEGKGDLQWAVSHWWVQRKGLKGIPERVYAV